MKTAFSYNKLFETPEVLKKHLILTYFFYPVQIPV